MFFINRLYCIQDVVASGCVALLYLAGGIALSYYVSLWSQPPDGCEAIRDLEINDPCSSQLLTAFGSIIAVSIVWKMPQGST